MMAFARKQDLAPTSVDPKSLIKSVAGLVQHTLGGTVRVDWDCSDDAQNFFADKSQLELALVNLIINARDAMPGGGRIEVSIHDISAREATDELDLSPGRYSCIRVRDQGQGIPDELISRVTEPFFTTKEAGKGTGLGLSMVSGFVQQSGGKMRIASRAGKGATIELFLPSTGQPEMIEKVSQAVEQRPIAGTKAVLLVDDDDAVRSVLGEQLREIGFEVDEAADGNSAIERLNGSTYYDVLLTDFAMPGINGLETIRTAIRQQPSLQPLLMTGYADEEAVADARSSVPIIRKPIDLDELVRHLV